MSSGNRRSPVFQADGVTKQLGEAMRIRLDSLRVFPGELVVFIGWNGSGKTTLCDLCTGFTKPDTGTMTLGGERVSMSRPAWFGRRGVLRTFQSPRTFDQMSIGDILTLAACVHAPPTLPGAVLWRFKPPCPSADHAQRILEEVGWRSMADRHAGTLSYGQRKLLAALTLSLANGKLAICDEPTAGLDGERARSVFQLLLRWKEASPERALVLVTHDLEYEDLGADRILRMVDGELKDFA